MKHFHLTLFAILVSFASYATTVIGPITGYTSYCQGYTGTPLSDTTTGGVWSSSNTAIITIGSTSGFVTAVSAGTATITYTKGGSYVTTPVIVNPLPNVYTLYIGGSGGICAGGPGTHIYLSGSQTSVGYQLYLGAVPIGTILPGTGSSIDFGSFTSAGAYSAVATDLTTGCANNMAGPATISILPTPAAIGGPSGVCVGSTITLTDVTSGGTWSSTNPSVATIGTTGTVHGLTVGTTIISYTLSSGCSATTTLNAVNTISSITGTLSVCSGTTTTLSDATTGGTWTSTNPSVATVGSASGVVTGVGAGTTTISYTVGGSCGAASATVTVHASPAGITGVSSVCAGAVSTLSDTTPGGVWSSGNPSVATIGSSSGIATSVGAGSALLSYTVAGCSSTINFTVDPRPIISGATGVCVTSFITLGTTINGSWTSSNPGVASVVTGFMAGTVTGVYPGTAIMTCTSYSTGCVSTYTVTVTSSCSGTPTAGTAHATLTNLCSGNADMLYLTGSTSACGISYQWQYSTDSLAWTNLTGATTDSVNINPQANLYYRCKLTCFSSGLYSYSGGVHVTVYNHITSHSVINTPSYFCNGPDFHNVTCGIAPNTNILTYYGDGTSDSTHLSSFTTSAVSDIYHNYNLPGMYTVKQILRDGVTPQDSVTFSFTYNYCRTLPISFYFDANSDCIDDAGDGIFYQPVTTEVDSNGIAIDTITAINGFYYEALGDSGTIYTFRVLSYDTGLHMSCPSTGILYDTIGAYANTYSTKYFGFTCNTSTSFDLGILPSITCGRHTADGTIYIDNSHCDAVSPVVTMTFSPKYVFGSSWPAPYSIAGNTVTWHLGPTSVYTGFTSWPAIYFNLSVTGPFLVAGDTVNTTYKVTPYAGDVDTTNNFVAMVNTIYASYDPNRMSVSPAGLTIPCTPLMYTVNFENTGNDTAHNISVIDTLPANVDASSLKLIASSAVVNLVVTTSGGYKIVKFDLPGINLPDSSHHDAAEGFIVFSAKAKASLADGSTISNRASIYFDDNLPVVTNSVTDTIGISPIVGPSSLCNTTHIQLNDASQNGTWTSNSHATVAAGLVAATTPGLDTIRYTLSNSCTSRTATKALTINAVVTPGVTIANGTGAGDTVCEGIMPIFTATETNGGSTPGYLWEVNGSGTDTGATFSYSPIDQDTLSVIATSSALCAIPDSAVAKMVLTVVPPYAPPITLNAYPGLFIRTGDADTFTASIPTGGPAPTYQWLLNGTPVPGATTDTFVSTTLNNNDSITIVVTGTDLCHLSTFNSFIVTVGSAGVKNISSTAQLILFPNPNNGSFTIRGKTGDPADNDIDADVVDMKGVIVYRKVIRPDNGKVNETFAPDVPLAKGMYFLNLRSGGDHVVFRFVVE